MYQLNLDDFKAARILLSQAIDLDANYAKAYAMAAKWHGLRFGQGWSSNPQEDAAETDRLASEAIRRDSGDALALALCGHHKAFLFRDYDRAIALFDRAIAAWPNSALAWTLSSPTYSYIGDGPTAIARAERGLRLSPLDPDAFWYQTALTLAYYASGNYEEAVKFGRKVAAAKPIFTANLRFLSASLAALGRDTEAHEVAHLLMQLEPRFSARRFATGYAFRDEARRRYSANISSKPAFRNSASSGVGDRELQHARAFAAAQQGVGRRPAMRRLHEVVGVAAGDREPEAAARREAPRGRQQGEAHRPRRDRRRSRHRARSMRATATPPGGRRSRTAGPAARW